MGKKQSARICKQCDAPIGRDNYIEHRHFGVNDYYCSIEHFAIQHILRSCADCALLDTDWDPPEKGPDTIL